MAGKRPKQKKYYKHLDIIRIIACIAVLLYHLGLLKSGCFAVCTFFALSGYLSCVTNFEKENFSLLKYYATRFLKIYIPMIVTTFTTILVISFFRNIKIINLKQELLSIFLGYNNFWQLKSNLDYFAKHINSPFMHFWYVAILMQFELIFPFIFVILKKLGDTKSQDIPVAISFSLGALSAIFFYKLILNSDLTNAYYNTFARAFSWLFGIALGFTHCYNKNSIFKKTDNEKIIKIIFMVYLVILIFSFGLFNEKQETFAFPITIATILTITLIDYGVRIKSQENEKIKFFSKLTYEIYLVQYPVIFICEHAPIFSFINRFFILKLPVILILTLISSSVIHFGLNKVFKQKNLTIFIRIIIFAVTAFGIYKFSLAKDYTEEMNELKKELQANKTLMEQRQKEFQQQNTKEFETEKESLNEKVKNLPVAFFGDSIMLGAMNNFFEYFPNMYIDAKMSRTAWDIYEPITQLVQEEKLGNPVVLHLGSNGDCSEKSKDALMQLFGEREVFWLTITNDEIVKMNSRLKEYAKKYSNLHIIDWEEESKDHEEYFAPDGVHLGKTAKSAYSKLIYDSIYNFYLQELKSQTQEKLDEFKRQKAKEEERLAKIAEMQIDILQFIFKKKIQKEEIIKEFQTKDFPQEYIEERIAELEQKQFIKANKKGVYTLTKLGKSEAKKLQ